MRQCKSNEVVCSTIVGEVDLDVVVEVPKRKNDEPEIMGVFLAATTKEPQSNINLKTLFEEFDYDIWEEVEEEYNEQVDSMEE